MKKGYSACLPGIVLLVVFVITSLCINKDYGMSYDEPTQRDMGYVSYNYITIGDTALNSYIDRDHGVGFELPLVWIEKTLGYTDTRDIYLMRHQVSSLFFICSMFCGYLLALKLFKDKWLASLGYLMLVLHPRIFAHSFFNTKDVPFLAVFVIGLLFLWCAFNKKKVYRYVLFGIACGYAESILVMGVLFLLLDMLL